MSKKGEVNYFTAAECFNRTSLCKETSRMMSVLSGVPHDASGAVKATATSMQVFL